MSTVGPLSVPVSDEEAVRGVPGRIVAAWAKNDPDAFAAVFTPDGSLILPGDVYLRSREEIRSFMAQAFVGPFKGTTVFGTPIGLKALAEDVVLLHTEGGVLAPGDSEVAPEHAIRASWLLVRQGSEWLITAYQNTAVQSA